MPPVKVRVEDPPGQLGLALAATLAAGVETVWLTVTVTETQVVVLQVPCALT